jgi:hypothetical protein
LRKIKKTPYYSISSKKQQRIRGLNIDELLPLLAEGASLILNILSVIQEKDKWIYFYGCLPVFSHAASDKTAFKMISSSFIITGGCRNIDIENVFHVSKRSIIRNCQKYSEFGAEGFIPVFKCQVQTPIKI